jgi:hypothetical protein
MASWDEYGGTLGDLHVNVNVHGAFASGFGGGGMDFFGGAIPILGGLTSLILANLRDPTWRPPVTAQPIQQHVTPPECVMIANEIQLKKNRIQKMLLRREAYRVALEKLQRGQNWENEIKEIASESQSAQTNAIMASLAILASAAGPLDTAIELWRERANAKWEHALTIRERLDTIKGDLLQKGLPEVNAVTETIRQQYDIWINAMKTRDGIANQFLMLKHTIDSLDKTLKVVEILKDLRERHCLHLGIKALPDTLVDYLKEAEILKDPALEITKDHLMEKLAHLGSKTAARLLSLGDFVVSYTYESARFYTSFKELNEMMTSINNLNRMSNILGSKILEITDHLKILKGEINELEKVRAKDDGDTCKEALRKIASQQLQEQYLAGEWFSQQTGVRAPGKPI